MRVFENENQRIGGCINGTETTVTVTKAADVDGDGKIGVSDATAILRYIARITDKL